MTPSIPELLTRSAEEVLETMFFTQVVSRRTLAKDGVPGAAEKPYLTVRLCFLGGLASKDSRAAESRASDNSASGSAQPGGHLDIEVSREGAQWIASSFLAADDGSVPQHRVADVICELTNVVCGNIMSNLASESGFSMLSPELIRGSSPEWPHAVRYEESFQLERGWLNLRLGLTSAT